MFGPYYKGKKNNVWSFQDSVEEFLQIIDELRIHETYKHENCAGKLFVTLYSSSYSLLHPSQKIML